MPNEIINLNDITINAPEPIELAQQTSPSIISVQREFVIDIDATDPMELDRLYASVPEISRTIDLRGAASIYRGYEIEAADDSQSALGYAQLCASILDKSGGVDFIEQWQKNADLYGNGYVELITDSDGDAGKVIELAHIHSYNFGYELETIQNQETGEEFTRIKLDKETKKPVGFASYKLNETTGLLENVDTYELNKIAHLKYKVIGDAFYGISIVSPMFGSVIGKLEIEKSIRDAARLVAAPKIVIKGDFPDEESARAQAKEAASLDVNDVIVLDNADDFKFVEPGQTSLPSLREIFITNITTASGIPRPVLTSESAEINKATLDSLMNQLRENMRSSLNKLTHLITSMMASSP